MQHIPIAVQLVVRKMGEIKRSSTLIFYYNDGQFVGENYLTGKLTIVNSPVLGILDSLDDFIDYEEFLSKFSHVPKIEVLVNSLIERQIIVENSSEIIELENQIDKWEWGLPARYYHSTTNYVNFEANNELVYDKLDEKSISYPPPSPYLEIAEINYSKLIFPSETLQGRIHEVLMTRRTCRAFKNAPILEQQLSDILYYTFGKTDEYSGGGMGDVIFKTSPSGGARHHAEVFVVINNVTGHAKGIYHYSVRDHSLGLIERKDLRKWGVLICSNQKWVENASALFIITSLLKRNMWKYENSHAYRVINMDIGHLGQTFNLVCNSMELGSFGTAALNSKLIEEKLSLNPYVQPAFYLCASGIKDNV